MKEKRKIQMLKNRNKAWYWRIKAANNKILSHSETYSSKTECFETAINLFSDMKNTIFEILDKKKITKVPKADIWLYI